MKYAVNSAVPIDQGHRLPFPKGNTEVEFSACLGAARIRTDVTCARAPFIFTILESVGFLVLQEKLFGVWQPNVSPRQILLNCSGCGAIGKHYGLSLGSESIARKRYSRRCCSADLSKRFGPGRQMHSRDERSVHAF